MMKPTSPSLKPSGNRIKPAFHRNALQHQTDCRASIVGRLCQTPIQPVRRFTETPYNVKPLKPTRDKAAALIIVLAFVVPLTGLVVAYLSRATMDRQMAQASFRDSDSDILARGALEIVVGDFKQEIVNGSTNFQYTNQAGQLAHFYTPTSNANVLPMRSGNPAIPNPLDETTDPIPNLIRRSVANDPITAPPGVGSRASVVNS